MKYLEKDRWFELFSLGVSAVMIYGLWRAVDLPIQVELAAIFMLACVGLDRIMNKVLAIILIKCWPKLGKVG